MLKAIQIIYKIKTKYMNTYKYIIKRIKNICNLYEIYEKYLARNPKHSKLFNY